MVDMRTPSTPSWAIESVSGGDRDALAAVARLHVDLLPHGLGQLGPRFVLDFLYRPGLQRGELHVGLARVDGAPAGFVTFTTSPAAYAGGGLAGQLPRAVAALVQSAIRDPRVIGAAWRVVRRSGERSPASAEMADAEILAFGVSPDFRSGPFVRTTGIRLSRALFDHAADRLAGLGRHTVQANIEADNLPTLQFYRFLGGRFVPMPPGHALQRVIVDLDTIATR
jgi:hypothetical protein